MRMKHTAWVMAVVGLAAVPSGAFADESNAAAAYGVYEYVIRNADGDVESLATEIEHAAARAGWLVAGAYDAAAPGDCAYRARVLVLYDATYAAELLSANPTTGGFAVLDRINVFEDERGTHVSVVNPHSITRTVLMNDTDYRELAENHLQALRGLIIDSVSGTPSHAQYGQLRSEGHIGKTMGVVAGGRFEDLLQEKARESGTTVPLVAKALRAGLEEPGRKWGMTFTYEVAIPEFDLVILGTTGSPMDSKSFDIVKAGGDESRKDFECPGLAHAGAYPLEMVVALDGDEVTVLAVEAMFRMKMYFEDAGKWAFMQNMKMPASIDKELKKQIREGLKTLSAS